jgi:hypothetical protein
MTDVRVSEVLSFSSNKKGSTTQTQRHLRLRIFLRPTHQPTSTTKYLLINNVVPNSGNDPKQPITHRLSPTDFQLMARSKLRLPIFPHEILCKCNKQHDIFGDHAFYCAKTHKGSTHNILLHKLVTILPPAFVKA